MATFVMDVIYKTGKRETSAERWHVGNFFCSLAIDDVDEYVEDFSSKAIEIMTGILETSYLHYDSPVPLLVHSSAGNHWGELK